MKDLRFDLSVIIDDVFRDFYLTPDRWESLYDMLASDAKLGASYSELQDVAEDALNYYQSIADQMED